jgi:uncharacterized Zn finger protein
MERICRQGAGLFPKPGEIRFSCSCPDGASMCKHVAAVMYGVGARLDTKPELLFRLRAVNENDLVANIGQGLPLSGHAVDSGKVLETDDMAALFGLEMGDAAEVASPQPVVAKTPASRRKAATAEAGKAAPVKKPALREKSVPVAVVGAADEAMRTGKVVSGKTRVAAKKPETPSPVAIVQASAKPVEWWKPGAVKQAARAAKAGQERPAAARKVRVAS